MRKTLAAVSLAGIVMAGCALKGGTPSHEELVDQGSMLYEQAQADAYTASVIDEIEAVRVAVNAAFLVARPAYEEYTLELMNYPEVNNFIKATESVESAEEKEAIYNQLSEEERKAVDDYLSSEKTKEIFAGLSEAAEVAMESADTFGRLDTKVLLKNLPAESLLTEKDRLSLTTKQVAYLNASVIHSYSNYKQIEQFKAAE